MVDNKDTIELLEEILQLHYAEGDTVNLLGDDLANRIKELIIELAERTSSLLDSLEKANNESTKYRHAYYEVMQALYKTDTSKEEKQRLFELG